MATADTTESAEFDLELARRQTDSVVFAEALLSGLADRGRLHAYLCALAEDSTGRSESSAARLGRVFAVAVKYLKQGSAFSAAEAKQLVSCLQVTAPVLPPDEVFYSIDKLLGGFRADAPAHALSGHAKALELLPYLIARASSHTRTASIEKLCAMKWEPAYCLMLSSALADICETREESELAVDKVGSLARWRADSNGSVALEDLPGLLYNLTLIGGKVSGAPDVKLRVLNAIADCIDGLAAVLHGSLPVGEPSQRALACPSTRASAGSILGSVVCHLTLLVSKDRELSAPMSVWIKSRTLFTPLDGENVSCARLVLCLMACAASPSDSKLLSSVRDLIQLVVAVEARAAASLWFQRLTWDGLVPASVRAVYASLELLVTGPFLQTGVVSALLSLGFQLLDVSVVAPKSSWASISTAYARCAPSPFATPPPDSCEAIGEWLLVTLFQQCEHTRGAVVREIVLKLLTSASLKGAASSKTRSSAAITKLLHSLVSTCAHMLLEVEGDLQELLCSLGDFDLTVAGDVVHAMSPLFRHSPSLFDRCVLCIRKATFSNDALCRMSAVAALTELLYFQTDQLDRRTSRQRAGAAEVSIDEVLLLLRRFLQHQSAVRSLLYERFLSLHHAFSSVRIILLRFLSSHLNSLLKTPSDHLGQVNSSSFVVLDLALCLDHHGAVCEPVHDLMLSLLIMASAKSASEDADEQYGCSQSAYQFERSHDVISALETLFRVSQALAEKDLDEFDLASVSSADALSRALLFVSAVQVAVVVVTMMPSAVGEVSLSDERRTELVVRLADRRLELLAAADKFKRSEEADRKKARRADGEAGSVAEEHRAGAAPKHVYDDVANLSKHEYMFTFVCVAMAALEDETTRQQTKGVYLELAVSGLEAAMRAAQHSMASQCYNFDRTTRRWSEFTESVEVACLRSIPLTLRLLVVSVAEKDSGLNSCDMENIARTFLALVRVLIVIEAATSWKSQMSADKSAKLAQVLSRSFDSVTGETTSARITPLIGSARKLQDMFLSVVSEEASAEVRRSACPSLLLAVLGDVVYVMDSTAKKAFTAGFLAKCSSYIGAPSTSVAQSIIELLALLCPASPADRVERCKEVATMIDQYYKRLTADSDESPPDNAEDRSFVSATTVDVSCEVLLGVFDKALVEMEYILKVRGQQQQTASSGEAGSDDEEEDVRPTDQEIVVICVILNRILTSMQHLIIVELGEDNVERLLVLLGKVYKVQVHITKAIVASKKSSLPETFKYLMETVSSHVTPRISKFLMQVQNSAGSRKLLMRFSRSIPALIFQMEQLDLQLIKLSGLVLEKGVVSRYIVKTSARDFKIEEVGDEEGGKQVRRKADPKRKRGKENLSSSNAND